jgi:hypothetical protein
MEAAADKVLTAAQVLIADRTRGHGDAAVKLDRDLVATICGYSSSKKCGWIFDYLESIGFLVIQRHYATPGRGRQADTFVTFDETPANYVGPRTYAELARALRDPERPLAATLFLDQDLQPRRSDRQSPHGNHRAGSASPDGDHQSEPQYPDGNFGPVSAGQLDSPHMGTIRPNQGAQMGTLVGESAGHPEQPHGGTFTSDQIDLLSPRGERGGRSIEPVPGGAAKPPATGMDERRTAAVRELVRRLPWDEWAKRREAKLRLTQGDADVVHAAICEAMASAGITLDQAAAVGLAALAEAKSNPVGYVADAFRKHLARRLRALAVEPLSDSPLPLPGKKPQAGPQLADQQHKGAAAANPDVGKPAKPVLPACATCGAREGEDWNFRTVPGDDGRERPCPACLPAAA